MSELRRIRIYVVSEIMLTMLFCQEATTRCMIGVPPDARFVGFEVSLARRAILIGFEHESFEPVPDNVEAPYFSIVLEMVENPRHVWEGHKRLGSGPLWDVGVECEWVTATHASRAARW